MAPLPANGGAADLAADVAIVGGGHAGLMTGAVLARLGFRVLLVERLATEAIRDAEPDGRSLALLAGSVRVAERFGLWRFLAASAAPVWRTEVTDALGGQRIVYDASEEGEAFGYGFEAPELRRRLLAAFSETAGPNAFVQGVVAGLDRGPRAIRLTLEDGRTIDARLAVAADGRGSRVRELAGIGTTAWRYDQAAIALCLDHDRTHAHVVREWLRPGGPLALLPLAGDHRTGVTWVEPAAAARERLDGGGPALLDELDRQTGGVLGRLEVASGPSLYPLGALHAERYVAPRVALVGDAAHGVHPIHAQGFNMGVADVGALADALGTARARGLDPGSGDALLPYARARRGANTGRLLLTDTLNRVSSAAFPPVARARGAVLAAVDRIGPVKRLAIRHGMQLGR